MTADSNASITKRFGIISVLMPAVCVMMTFLGYLISGYDRFYSLIAPLSFAACFGFIFTFFIDLRKRTALNSTFKVVLLLVGTGICFFVPSVMDSFGITLIVVLAVSMFCSFLSIEASLILMVGFCLYIWAFKPELLKSEMIIYITAVLLVCIMTKNCDNIVKMIYSIIIFTVFYLILNLIFRDTDFSRLLDITVLTVWLYCITIIVCLYLLRVMISESGSKELAEAFSDVNLSGAEHEDDAAGYMLEFSGNGSDRTKNNKNDIPDKKQKSDNKKEPENKKGLESNENSGKKSDIDNKTDIDEKEINGNVDYRQEKDDQAAGYSREKGDKAEKSGKTEAGYDQESEHKQESENNQESEYKQEKAYKQGTEYRSDIDDRFGKDDKTVKDNKRDADNNLITENEQAITSKQKAENVQNAGNDQNAGKIQEAGSAGSSIDTSAEQNEAAKSSSKDQDNKAPGKNDQKNRNLYNTIEELSSRLMKLESENSLLQLMINSSVYDLSTITDPDYPYIIKIREENPKSYRHCLKVAQISADAAGLIKCDSEEAYAIGMYMRAPKFLGDGASAILAKTYRIPKSIITSVYKINDKTNVTVMSREAGIVMLTDDIIYSYNYLKSRTNEEISIERIVNNAIKVRKDQNCLRSAGFTNEEIQLLRLYYNDLGDLYDTTGTEGE